MHEAYSQGKATGGRQEKWALKYLSVIRRPRHDDAIDFFGKRYSTIRQFAPTFLQTLTFRAQGPNNPVLPAVNVIRDLDRAPTRRPVPKDAPMSLITDVWRPYIRESDGSISRRYYELCTLWHLRSALRSGNIWVEHSRRYTNLPPALPDEPSRDPGTRKPLRLYCKPS